MKPLTREWVAKAEGDFQTARRELRARKFPNFDSAAFHAQQCVEKYFKARLQEAGESFPHTHDLAILLNLLLKIEPLWNGLAGSAATLTDGAVKVRYPGSSITRIKAKDAVARCREIRALVRKSLGLRA